MVNDEGHLMIILVIFLFYESMVNEGCYIITVDISLLLQEGMTTDEGCLKIHVEIFYCSMQAQLVKRHSVII